MDKNSVVETCYSILIKEYNIADYEKKQVLDRVLFDFCKEVSDSEYHSALIELFRKTMKYFIEQYTKDIDFTNYLIAELINFDKYINNGGEPHFYLWKDLIDIWEKCMIIEHSFKSKSYKGESYYYDSTEDIDSLNINFEGFDELIVPVLISKSGTSRKKLLSLTCHDNVFIKKTKVGFEVRDSTSKLGMIEERQEFIDELISEKRIQYIIVYKVGKTHKFAWDTPTYSFYLKIFYE